MTTYYNEYRLSTHGIPLTYLGVCAVEKIYSNTIVLCISLGNKLMTYHS